MTSRPFFSLYFSYLMVGSASAFFAGAEDSESAAVPQRLRVYTRRRAVKCLVIGSPGEGVCWGTRFHPKRCKTSELGECYQNCRKMGGRPLLSWRSKL